MTRILTQEDYDNLPLIIAVDFDKTLGLVQKYRGTGIPNQDIIDKVKRLKAAGCKIILWTCRDNENEDRELDAAVEFCREQGIELDAVNENIPEVKAVMDGDTRKVYANWYIDDKAIGIPQWHDGTLDALVGTIETLARRRGGDTR